MVSPASAFRMVCLGSLIGLAQGAAAQASFEDQTKGLLKREGLITTFLDTREGKVFFSFPAPETGDKLAEVLYNEGLTTGLGNNEFGLDRGEPGQTYVLRFRLVANKVFLEAPNYSFRASSKSETEREATRRAFPTSILWSAPVAARSQNGTILVNMTDFLVRDAHGIADGIEGTFNAGRSALLPEAAKSFPDNLEFDAMLTFTTAKAGRALSGHAPDPKTATFVQHHSFVRLPDDNFRPRPFDPRSGSFAVTFRDFSSPLGSSLLKQYTVRHRLQKVRPGSAPSPVVKPIVYYVDPGAPPQIREALITGGNYWKKAFEAAGFMDGFRVEVMPEGMDPMDARYNVVHWTNRSTRGWAFGSTVTDPRTGEIVRGVVNLDSQRVRQDIMLFEGLVGAALSGTGKANDPIQVALARVRQLSAHEIGHTLGFQHNFAASVNDRASVMDYPAPRVRVTSDKQFDLSEAYAPGIGQWDVQTVKYAYSEFDAGANEHAELKKIVKESANLGLLFLPDSDASESSGADPRSTRWDDHRDPIEGLREALRVRRIAISRFGQRNIAPGRPISDLEIVFGPVFFYHRYAIDAAAKVVGGIHYRHSLTGEAPSEKVIDLTTQMKALDALLACLQPSELEVPAHLARLFGRRTNGQPSSAESFASTTPFAFDSVTASASAADLVLARLLDPDKCARIVEISARYPGSPSLEKILDRVAASVLARPTGSPRLQEIRWSIHHAYVARLIQLAERGSQPVKARALVALKKARATELALAKRDRTGHADLIATEVARFLTRQRNDSTAFPSPKPALPGSPIGGG